MKRFIYIAWLVLAASMDLHSFCSGDPLNLFDPTGCISKDAFGGGVAQDQINALTDQYYAENGYGHTPDMNQVASSVLDAVPVVGAAKMMLELGTGSDLVTGQPIQGNGTAQGVGILLNVLGVAMPMMEVGMGAIAEEAIAEGAIAEGGSAAADVAASTGGIDAAANSRMAFEAIESTGELEDWSGIDYEARNAASDAEWETQNAAEGGINYGALDSLGRPTGVTATITGDMIGTGTTANPSIIPPGWSGNGILFNEARGHLLGAQLGGSGDVAENLVTLQQNPANSPIMRGFENQVRSAVQGGQTVNYSATPIYDGLNLVPRGITIIGTGSGDFNLGVTILNPIGR
jgi:hypothetical protein